MAGGLRRRWRLPDPVLIPLFGHGFLDLLLDPEQHYGGLYRTKMPKILTNTLETGGFGGKYNSPR
jgi:hypothetical protein